ncbi:hypothetical protein ACEWY4_004638 [Coilia grayii]|uniref:Uncharacterized protein n=1 Tax=Coilia grayii TaxID=363190 RepID=A0ABD1KM29_9TELE
MSKRRRRNSRRRKSSSGSKQSICPYNLQKHTKSPRNDDVVLMDEHAEKGEADSLHKENSLCKSDAEEEEEEKERETPCGESSLRRDSTVGCFQGNSDSQAGSPSDEQTPQRSDEGVRITTSVTIENLEEKTSQIVLQRSHGSDTTGAGNSTIAVTTTKFKGIQANMKIEISEVLRLGDSDYKTTFVLQSQKAKNSNTSSEGQQNRCSVPNNERFTFPHPWIQGSSLNDSKIVKPFENVSYEFSVVEMSKEGVDMQTDPMPIVCHSEDTDCYKSCCQDRCYGYGHFSRYDTDFALVDGSSSLSPPSDIWPLQKNLSMSNSISSETQVDIPPPVEFADREFQDGMDDLTEDVAMCHMNASDEASDLEESASVMTFVASSFKRESTCCPSTERGRSDDGSGSTSTSGSDSDELETEDLSMWPDAPMSRSSFTKNFIDQHKRKACMRNNSIGILKSRTPPADYVNVPRKRRKTFPTLMDESGDHQEDMTMCRGSFSSGALSPFFTQSLARERERSERFYLDEDLLSTLYPESKSSKCGSALATSPARRHSMFSQMKCYACSPTGNGFVGSDRDAGTGERGLQELAAVRDANPGGAAGGPHRQSDVTESGFYEDVVDMESHGEGVSLTRAVSFKDYFIHITPPSPGSSKESNINCCSDTGQSNMSEVDIEQHASEPDVSQTRVLRKECAGDAQPKSRKASVITVTIVGSEQRILRSHSQEATQSGRSHREDNNTAVTPEPHSLRPIADADQMEEGVASETGRLTSLSAPLVSESSTSIQSPSPLPYEATDLQSDSSYSLQSANTPQEDETKEEGALEKHEAKSTAKRSIHAPHTPRTQASETLGWHSSTKLSSDIKQQRLITPVTDPSHKEPEEAIDHWARRRKLFKDSKHQSSAGGGSFTSNITDESDTMFSDDFREVETRVKDIEDMGFYTETFHCAAWIYRGDDVSHTESPRCLSKRPRPVTIRERTVKITKGFGEYPWGFRIQFSKPIVVTEVDTNGAAEEAGLLVGDSVLVVNGTDVSSAPHSEAADLARQGPDLLTLIIGSDISRCPNTPRPACRGYLHKRTQSSLIKGWRRRWFVLRHDCCLYYYRYKKDEGKSQALSKLKMEGAEVEADTSLGKPFVFKCSPASGGRVYYFCATSNQDMKRWLEAMSQAVRPLPPAHVFVDVTRHNASLPPLAVKAPECLGLLHQLDRTKDVWVQNYCILKDGCLYLYAGFRSTYALGGLYLHGYSVREQPMGSKRSTIELRPPSGEFKTFHLCAENPAENKRWILAIRASISKWVPLHQAIQDYMSKPPEETRM